MLLIAIYCSKSAAIGPRLAVYRSIDTVRLHFQFNLTPLKSSWFRDWQKCILIFEHVAEIYTMNAVGL